MTNMEQLAHKIDDIRAWHNQKIGDALYLIMQDIKLHESVIDSLDKDLNKAEESIKELEMEDPLMQVNKLRDEIVALESRIEELEKNQEQY